MNATAPSYQVEHRDDVNGGVVPFVRRPRPSWTLLTQAPLHDFPVRDEILFQYLALRAEMDVAEVGLGTGFTSCWLAGQARSYTGIDVSAATVDRLRAELQHLPNATFVCADLAKPDVPDRIAKRFDVVYGLDVFEYVPNPQICLQNLARILQSDGMMLLSYPNVPPPRGDGVTWFEKKETLEALIVAAGFSRFEIVELRLRPWASKVYGLLHERPIGLYRNRHKAERATEDRPQIYEDTWAFQKGQRLNRYRPLLHGSWEVLGALMRLFGPVYESRELSGDQNMLGRQLLIRAWK
jgi:SAM-dependent methyltransferase